MDTFFRDLRYGLRMLTKNPGFTLIAVITLALGIGANTAIFSVVNAVLLRPLPYPEPERLMKVYQSNTAPGKGSMPMLWSYPRFEALRDPNQTLAGVAAYASRSYNLTGSDEPERLEVEFVSAAYFSVLGINAALGRSFTAEEDKPRGAQPVALISYGLWQRRFGGDESIVGRTIELEKRPLTVAGVLPAGFKGQSGLTDAWLPMMTVPTLMSPVMLTQPRSYWVQVIARLKPDVELAQAQAEMGIITEQIEKLYPGPTQSRPSGSGQEVITLVPLKEANINPAFRRSFLILLAATGFVLLIACANTANLMLSRAVARRKEFAVRRALGASGSRLIRQLLTESILLALLGGGLGLIVALWVIDLLNQLKPTDAGQFWTSYTQVFRFYAIRLDGMALGFNFLLATMTGVLFGLIPAWQASRPDLTLALKESAGSTIAGFRGLRQSARSALVVGEMALSMVLLVGAGLMIHSLARIEAVRLGFDPNNVVMMNVISRDVKQEFYRELYGRIAALPGVESVSVASSAPLSGYYGTANVGIEGGPADAMFADFHMVSHDYFRTLRINVLKGRSFTEQDRIGAKRVAIINQAAAQQFFGGEDPLGKRLRSGFAADYPNAEPLVEIVGIVDDVKYGRIEEDPKPGIYLSAWQPIGPPSLLIVRAQGDIATRVAAVRREVRALDKNMPVYGIKTMTERAAEVTSRTRFVALLLGLFAGLALILSATGIYGVMAYAVSSRTQEIGIRIALGARTGDVLGLVLRQGFVLTLIGLVMGLAGSYAASRALTSQLYGVSATDPVTFVGVAALLVAVALLACWIPARRATKVDPMIALRCE